jgi:hypothetical protein
LRRLASLHCWQKMSALQQQTYAMGCISACYLGTELIPALAEFDRPEQCQELAREEANEVRSYAYAYALQELVSEHSSRGFNVDSALTSGGPEDIVSRFGRLVQGDPSVVPGVAALLASRLVQAEALQSVRPSQMEHIRNCVRRLRLSGVWQDLTCADQALMMAGILAEPLPHDEALHVTVPRSNSSSPGSYAQEWSPSLNGQHSGQCSPTAVMHWGGLPQSSAWGGLPQSIAASRSVHTPTAHARSDSICSVESGVAVVRGASPGLPPQSPAMVHLASTAMLLQRLQLRQQVTSWGTVS